MPNFIRSLASASLLVGVVAHAQAPTPTRDQSAVALQHLVDGIAVTPRVLVVGMHPDDADDRLIAWLSRGRHIETAYLSVTRGENGEGEGGNESGTLLGAVRVQELLESRRIDGAHQYFTRAYDFGYARNAAEVFKRWNRDSVVGDIVAIIRSFRPHVIVAMIPDSATDGDGQHQALATLMDHAFTSSMDNKRFPSSPFGVGWPVAKMYKPGKGLRIETGEYDRASGKTYAAIATEARAMRRSEGLRNIATPQPTVVELQRIATRLRDTSTAERSMFAGIDTSMARLTLATPPQAATSLRRYAAYADSLHASFDPLRPSASVPLFSQLAYLATLARGGAIWCGHPDPTATPPHEAAAGCDATLLDLDASVDLLRQRANAALLIAAGVSIEATADRELLANADTATVSITVANHGSASVTLTDINAFGSFEQWPARTVVQPESTVTVTGRVTRVGEGRAWWAGARGGPERGGERFDAVLSTLDGVQRPGMIPAELRAYVDVMVPEDYRRPTDATVQLNVAGISVLTSLGAFVHPHADATVGLQYRPMGGVPNVTLQFARGLEWLPRNKPLDRSLRVAVKSHSDLPQTFALTAVAPRGMPVGVRVESLPPTMHLQPHEQRELFVKLRGNLKSEDRLPIALTGSVRIPKSASADVAFNTHVEPYQSGIRVSQRDYLPPVRMYPSSGEWLQPIDIDIPPSLTTLYIPSGADDIATALKQVGAWATEASTPDQLLSVDLSKVRTVAFGAQVFETQPAFLGQIPRLLDFVRKGGNLVILRQGTGAIASQLFPYPVSLASPVPDRVSEPDAPIKILDPTARILSWPNKITETDWSEWIGQRALNVPATADPRYGRPIETHDTNQAENRNTILTARVGKGTIIYTTLALDQQIAGGIPGALRLFVNMLSAGMPR